MGPRVIETTSPRVAEPGLLHPLRHGGYALIAGATLVSNVGVWMRDTTSAWTIASAPANHSAAALVQAATLLPTFLLALPAGVLADHYDRRRILISCQAVLAACGAVLAVLSARDAAGPGAVVLVAFVAGSAAALSAPAFQALVPELVPREDVRPAVALGSVSFNVARVVGPALGGLVLAGAGPAAAYLCNALAYLAVIVALVAVGPLPAPPNAGPVSPRAELHQGFAFAAASSRFRRTIARAAGLHLCAAAYLTLTPLVAHDVLGRSSTVYSQLLAATGIGAVLGAALLSALRRRGVDDDAVLLGCGLAGAGALLVFAVAWEPLLASLALAVAGGATLIQLSTLNALAQLVLPAAIRGRGLSIYLAACFGAMALGSLTWGAIAGTFGLGTALTLGGLGFAGNALVGRHDPVAAAGAPA